MTEPSTASRSATLLALPAALAVGWALGGPRIGLESVAWCAFGLLNVLAIQVLAARTSAALAAGVPGPAWVWAIKMPVTVALVVAGLQVSDPRALLAGVAAAMTALVWRHMLSEPLSPAAATPAASEER